jgi:hypothetical protein
MVLSQEMIKSQTSESFIAIQTAEEANKVNPALVQLARTFVSGVGSPGWERMFGKYWDEAWAARRESGSAQYRLV